MRSMKRDRTISNYASVKHPTKQHCPEDLSCGACCRCVERLMKQNKILLDKVQNWGREKEMLEKEILRLRKQIREWEKKKAQFDDLPELKRRLRQQLRFEMDKERKVEDMILKQRFANTKEERNALKKQRDDLLEQQQEQKKAHKKQLQSKNKQIQELNESYNDLEQKFLQKCKQFNTSDSQLKRLTERNQTIEKAVKDKTDIISKMEEQLRILQNNLITEKARSADFQFQIIKSQNQAKTAAQSVQSLKKQALQNTNSIKQLTSQNTRLDNIVKQLDGTIYSYTQLEGELRNRIIVTEDYALQKEIQAQQIEADFYDAINRRTF